MTTSKRMVFGWSVWDLPRAIAVLLWLALSSQAGAQVTTATISGTVKDQTGAVLPGVSITIRNVGTGGTRTLTTDGRGRYSAPNLGIGDYEVDAQLSGFQAEVRRGITLTVGREAVVDMTLNVGDITQQVEVTGEAPLVETTTANIASLVDDKRMRDLPLNGRDLIQLTTLNLGVLGVRNAGTGQTGNYGDKISVSGARPTMNNYMMDGTDTNDARNRTPGSVAGVMLGVETVQEFSILTFYSAEFGRAAGGVVNAVTKSGTNAFHGSLFEFLRNSALDARNFFDVGEAPDPSPVPPFKRNQFGFTFGGPIQKNRTFFFGSLEALRERLTTTQTAIVPTAEGRLGILPNLATPITVHPNIRPLVALYPLPTPGGRDFKDGTAELVFASRQPADDTLLTARIDHVFSDTDNFFVRYTRDRAEKSSPGAAAVTSNTETTANHYVTLEEKRIFTPSLLNIFRFGFNRSFVGQKTTALTDAYKTLSFVPGQPLGNGTVTGLAEFWPEDVASSPVLYVNNTFEFIDNVTWIKGGHSLKTGFNVKRIPLNQLNPGRIGGRLSFNSLTNFLNGRPNRLQIVEPGSTWDRYWRMSLSGFYVQDDWNVMPNLTLNLGLRYEFITVPTEKQGRVANIRDPLHDSQVTVGDPLFENPSLKNFAPRIGFAWSPGGTGKTSIRGGFGFFYDQIMILWFHTAGSRMSPFFTLTDYTNPPYPDLLSGASSAALQLNTFPFQMNTPYLLRYNLNVQHQLLSSTVLTVGYSGSRGVHVGRLADVNMAIPQILPDGRYFFPVGSTRRNPKFAEIRMRSADSDSFYNSLLVGVNRRFAQGFQLQAAYTFSRAIDEGSGTQTAGDFDSEAATQINWQNHKMNRGLAAFHLAHNFVLNGTYDLPLGSSLAGVPGVLVKGWQIGGILNLSTGTPFTVLDATSSTLADATAGTNRPDLAPGASNNPVLGGPDQYFDSSAFVPAPRNVVVNGVTGGLYGNLGRNTLIGPGLAVFDLSLVKVFPIREGKSLQFRSEFFNLFNRANFGTPARTVFNSSGLVGSAGRIDHTTTTSREIQFGIKFIF